MLLKALNRKSYTSRSEQINWNGSDISVEHLLPQKSDIGLYPYSKTATLKREDETLDLFRKRLIDTVGNLTLITQPLNSAISNGAFPMKAKAIAEGSDLRINAEFRNNPQELWDEESIIVRGDRLFKLALDIWPYPNQISQS